MKRSRSGRNRGHGLPVAAGSPSVLITGRMKDSAISTIPMMDEAMTLLVMVRTSGELSVSLIVPRR